MSRKTSNSRRGYRSYGNDSWLKLNEYRCFLNMVRNFNGEVSDRDFFDPLTDADWAPGHIGDQSTTQPLMRLLADHFGLPRLSAMGLIDRDDTDSGSLYTTPSSLQHVFAEIWNRKSLRRSLRKLLEKWVGDIVARLSPASPDAPPDPMALRANDIAELLHLDDLERDLFAFFAVRSLTYFDDFPTGSWSHSRKVNLCAMAIDRPADEVAVALQPDGRLRRYGVIDLDECNLAVTTFRAFLESGGSGGAALLRSNFYKSADTSEALPLAFHGDLADLHAPLLLPLLSHPAPRAPNVLLYGAPGTGKTAFAHTLARELGLDLVEITHPHADTGNDLPSTRSRAIGIRLANENFASGRTLLLVDEADQLLKTNASPFDALASAVTDKGLVNALLDEAVLPTLWLANTAADALDESVRRRFDYSIRFDALSPEKRLAIWRNAAEKLGLEGLVSPDAARRLAHRFPTNAGGIANALLNAKRLGATPDAAEALLSSFLSPHCELLGIQPADDAPSSSDYSLDGLNVAGPVPPADVLAAVRRFRAERRAPAAPDRPRLNILLYGPPGTGKTEFVKFLARSVGAPVALRTASSLLAPYVGETEANIRNAFRDAAASAAILFLDDFDGLLFDRAASRYRWEYTQVNEILHGLENFGGVLLAATNHLDALDPAVLRRFTLKLRFDYLEPDGKRLFFDRFFGLPLDPAQARRLDGMPRLAPGDFRTVRQALHYLSASPTPDLLLDALEKETALKRDPFSRPPIGFAPPSAAAPRPHPFAPPDRPDRAARAAPP